MVIYANLHMIIHTCLQHYCKTKVTLLHTLHEYKNYTNAKMSSFDNAKEKNREKPPEQTPQIFLRDTSS